MDQKKFKVWNYGQKLGVGVFLMLSVVLKLVEENMIPENWKHFATLVSCLVAWQVVVVAYQRGCQDGATEKGEAE